MSTSKKHILVVGGGFGGIKAALELAKHKDFEITLLSDRTSFRYYPTLFHTATGGLYAQSSIPLHNILPEKRVRLATGTAKKIDQKARTVTTEEGETYSYDIVILALGVVTNYFGIEGLEEFSYGIKSIEQIREFKNHLHGQMENDRKADLNYIIVGAGPTGIELAGALPAYLTKIMRNHGIEDRQPKVTIIEAAPRLLPHSPQNISSAVQKRLKKLGVELRLDQKVEGQSSDALMVNGKEIKSQTVIWTAGTANNPFFSHNNFTIVERGKVDVDEFLRSSENVYVIGDNANTQFSGQAQTALHDAVFVANDIAKRHAGHTPVAYQPKKPITVIPVGHGWAAVEWGKMTFSGVVGWFLRQAADWVGFHDFQPWWKASQQWMTEFGHEEDCKTCDN